MLTAAAVGGLLVFGLSRLLDPSARPAPPAAPTPASSAVAAMAPMRPPAAEPPSAPVVAEASPPIDLAPPVILTDTVEPIADPPRDRPARTRHGVSAPSTGGSTAAGTAAAGGPFAPSVSVGGLRFAGMSSSADLRGPLRAAGDWSTCWPRDVPPPTVNQGRDFLVDIAADGHVVSVAAAPNSEEPAAFASCVSRRMTAITFPPPATGAQVQVRINFHIGG